VTTVASPCCETNARKVETAKPGKYSDGGNLYLIVSETGARKWVLRFTWRGRAKEMGLGSAGSVPLADARETKAAKRHLHRAFLLWMIGGLAPGRGDGIHFRTAAVGSAVLASRWGYLHTDHHLRQFGA
jgi:hypothetical protein